MSFWIVPESSVLLHALLFRCDHVAGEHRQHRAVHRHRDRDLVERNAVEQDLHVLDRVDRDARLADVADDARVVGVVAAVGSEVEGDRHALLAGRQVAAVERVRFFGGGETGVLPDRPRAHRVHRRLRPAHERLEAGQGVGVRQARQVVGGVQRLDVDAFGRVPDELLGRAGGLRGGLLPVGERGDLGDAVVHDRGSGGRARAARGVLRLFYERTAGYGRPAAAAAARRPRRRSQATSTRPPTRMPPNTHSSMRLRSPSIRVSASPSAYPIPATSAAQTIAPARLKGREPQPVHPAHPDRDRAHGPQAVQEPYAEDERRVVAVEQLPGPLGARLERRPAREHPLAGESADREIDLIAEEAARRRDRDHPRQREVAAVRGDRGEHQDRLAFEEGPDEHHRVAVGLDERGEIHDDRRRGDYTASLLSIARPAPGL